MTKQGIGRMIDRLNISALLLGFPKCGTTSLADLLSGVAGIEVSQPKETFLLAPEFGRSALVPRVGPFTSTSGLRVEASTLNVYSSELLAAVAERDTKVIIVIRSPWEALPSWHNQLVRAGLDGGATAESLWQEEEPGAPRTAQFLRKYRSCLAYGSIAQQWVDVVGHHRVLMLDIEDFSDTEILCGLLGRFLGIQIPVTEVPRSNTFGEIRLGRLYRMLKRNSVTRRFLTVLASSPRAAGLGRWVRQNVVEQRGTAHVALQPSILPGMTEQYAHATALLDVNRAVWAD